MDSSHIAASTITALLATVIVYLSNWPWQPLDLPTASAFAGLIVAGAGAAVKIYKSYRPPPRPKVVVNGPGGLARE
jgi:NhaP-type Na+/H+ or K+/H+ antiporter